MSLLRRVLNLGRSNRVQRDIDREMSFHIEERVEELVATGMPRVLAESTARRRFGNRTIQVEDTRRADLVGWADSFLGDVRYAMRALRRSPVFTLVAVASLAIGIGFNTSIYSLIDAVVLRPLPVPAPEEMRTGTSRTRCGSRCVTGRRGSRASLPSPRRSSTSPRAARCGMCRRSG
jgi:putative ABC transport system permease protein